MLPCGANALCWHVQLTSMLNAGARGSDVAMAENAAKLLKRKVPFEGRDEMEKGEKDAAPSTKTLVLSHCL